MAGKITTRDRGLRRFQKRLKSLAKGVTVTVGVQGKEAEQSYDDGTPVVVVAAVHEFGREDGSIPQRSYLRSTFDANRKKYERMIPSKARMVIKGGPTGKQVMFEIGETLREDVVKAIKAGIPPPLAPATIARKGSTLPLVDWGILMAAISTVVREGGKPIA